MFHSTHNSGICRTALPRRGVAAVETAVVLPVVVLILLATFELCQVLFMRNSVLVAAYEGARVAIVPGARAENVEIVVRDILNQRNLQPASITIQPANFQNQPAESLVTVEIQVSARDNSSMPLLFHRNTLVTENATMMLEQ